jgi:predicted nuclease with RNAse H fold
MPTTARFLFKGRRPPPFTGGNMNDAARSQLQIRDTLVAAVAAVAPRATVIPNWWFERVRTVTVQHVDEQQAAAVVAAAARLGYETHHDPGRCIEIYVAA